MTAKVELLTPSGGKVILDPTNTAVDRVLTLPAVAGTVFNQGNVVGTVSQSSGVPTGSIIERGSNANGEFVKYADGTMICYGSYTGGIPMIVTAVASMFAGNVTLTMPASSVVNWHVLSFSGNNQNNSEGWGGKSSSSISGTSCNFRYYSTVSTITGTAIQWAVIGRWF